MTGQRDQRRVLVTGAAGFIGSHVTDALIDTGYEVIALDNLSSGKLNNLPEGIEFVRHDLREPLRPLLKKYHPAAVVHQAAQISVSRSVREPFFDADSNIMGTLRLLQACADTGVNRVVFASSGGVLYGETDTPAAETQPPDPQSPYGIAKLTAEYYLRFFYQHHGLPSIALRYGNVYGPRQDPHGEAGVVAIFTNRLLQQEPATINGDGRYVRDYVYVQDVARANVLALETGVNHGVFNIGTGQGTDVNQLYGFLSQITGVETPAQYGPARPGDLRRNVLDPGLARAELGWKPEVELQEGLARTVDWFRHQLNR